MTEATERSGIMKGLPPLPSKVVPGKKPAASSDNSRNVVVTPSVTACGTFGTSSASSQPSIIKVDSQTSSSSTLTLRDQFAEFRASLLEDVKALLSQSQQQQQNTGSQSLHSRDDDQISIAASAYSSIHGTNNNENIDPRFFEEISNNPRPYGENRSENSTQSVANQSTDNLSDLFPGSSNEPAAKRQKLKSSNHGVDQQCESDKPKTDNLNMIEEILVQIDKELPLNKEEAGPKVNEGLAKRVIKLFKNPALDSEAKKALLQRHKIPENLSGIATPAVNQAIREMRTFTAYHKRNERDLYEIQQLILRASVAATTLADKSLRADQACKVMDTKEVVKDMLDVVTLLGQASHNISEKRKSNIKYILAPDVRTVCNSEHGGTQLLGDDLGKSLREAREISRVSSSFSSRKDYYRDKTTSYKEPSQIHGKSYHNYNHKKQARQSFLERGKRSQQGSKLKKK